MKVYSSSLGIDVEVPIPDIEAADKEFEHIRLIVMANVFNNLVARDALLSAVQRGQTALRTPAKDEP